MSIKSKLQQSLEVMTREYGKNPTPALKIRIDAAKLRLKTAATRTNDVNA